MENLKEIYFTSKEFDPEVSLLRDEIKNLPFRIRNWDAEISKSALIVTDLQNYFLSPDSHAFIPSAPAITPKINQLIGHFRKYRRPVIFTRHINDQTNANSMAWWWNDLIGEGTWMSKLVSDLDVQNDQILVKHQYDAFYGTSLQEILKSGNIQFPVICGVMANLCCETTVRSAFVMGFRPLLPLDATAAYNRETHISTFRNLAFGFMPILTTSELIAKISP